MSCFRLMIVFCYVLKSSKLWNKSWQMSSQVTFINVLKLRSNIAELLSQYTWNYGMLHISNWISTSLVSNSLNRLSIRHRSREIFTFSRDCASSSHGTHKVGVKFQLVFKSILSRFNSFFSPKTVPKPS